ncbi:hypothetical protein Tco_0462889 [Tanacetum coccineum]
MELILQGQSLGIIHSGNGPFGFSVAGLSAFRNGLRLLLCIEESRLHLIVSRDLPSVECVVQDSYGGASSSCVLDIYTTALGNLGLIDAKNQQRCGDCCSSLLIGGGVSSEEGLGYENECRELSRRNFSDHLRLVVIKKLIPKLSVNVSEIFMDDIEPGMLSGLYSVDSFQTRSCNFPELIQSVLCLVSGLGQPEPHQQLMFTLVRSESDVDEDQDSLSLCIIVRLRRGPVVNLRSLIKPNKILDLFVTPPTGARLVAERLDPAKLNRLVPI